MRNAADLDEQVVSLHRCQRAVALACELEPPLVGPEPAGGDLDRLPVDRHPVLVGADPRDRQPV